MFCNERPNPPQHGIAVVFGFTRPGVSLDCSLLEMQALLLMIIKKVQYLIMSVHYRSWLLFQRDELVQNTVYERRRFFCAELSGKFQRFVYNDRFGRVPIIQFANGQTQNVPIRCVHSRNTPVFRQFSDLFVDFATLRPCVVNQRLCEFNERLVVRELFPDVCVGKHRNRAWIQILLIEHLKSDQSRSGPVRVFSMLRFIRIVGRCIRFQCNMVCLRFSGLFSSHVQVL